MRSFWSVMAANRSDSPNTTMEMRKTYDMKECYWPKNPSGKGIWKMEFVPNMAA